MRKLSSCFFLAFLVTGCAAPVDTVDDEPIDIDGQIGETHDAVTQADKDWWKNQLQLYRNWYIVSRAYQDNGKYVGLNCKDWARKVVLEASHGVVSLPATTPTNAGWAWTGSPYVKNVGNVYDTMYGDIIQSNHLDKNGIPSPHTAIVVSNDRSNICWIDSNWVATNKVGTHCETIQHFLSTVIFNGMIHYNAYRITGG